MSQAAVRLSGIRLTLRSPAILEGAGAQPWRMVKRVIPPDPNALLESPFKVGWPYVKAQLSEGRTHQKDEEGARRS